MVLLPFGCFLSGLVIFYGISFLLHAGNHGFGGAQVPIVVVHWSIPVVRSFTGPLSPFTRAARFWGVVGASCVQTFLLLSVRHGLLTLYLPSLQILTASLEFFRSINWPIRGPLVLTLRPSLTCLSQPLLSPTLLGLRPCDRTLCLRLDSFGGTSPGSTLLPHMVHHFHIPQNPFRPSSSHCHLSMSQLVLLGIPLAGTRGVSLLGWLVAKSQF
jgi:hypothetical protein